MVVSLVVQQRNTVFQGERSLDRLIARKENPHCPVLLERLLIIVRVGKLERSRLF